ETKCTEIDAALWDQVMAVNLRGPFLMVKHVAPHMQAQGYGKIINIGSGTAYRGIPWMLHYVTSKGGHRSDDAGALARARRARHPRQYAGTGLHVERHGSRGESGPRPHGARARGAVARAASRRAPAGPDRSAGVSGLGRQRFRHRPDHRCRRGQREYVMFSKKLVNEIAVASTPQSRKLRLPNGSPSLI